MHESELDAFGQFIVANLRDRAIQQHEMLQKGQIRAARVLDLQRRLAQLSDEQRQLVRSIVIDVVDTALHDVLFAIQDAHDRDLGIEVSIRGKNVAELSSMLQGEIYGDRGWIKRFSHFAGLEERTV